MKGRGKEGRRNKGTGKEREVKTVRETKNGGREKECEGNGVGVKVLFLCNCSISKEDR